MAESIGRSDGEESKCNGAQGDEKKRMATENKNNNEKMAHIYHFIIIRLWNGTTVPFDRVRMASTTSEREKRLKHGRNNERWARIRRTLACHGTDSQCKYRNFVFSICVFIFCISFRGSWRRFDVLTLFVRTQRKSQRAIHFSATLQFTRRHVCPCECVMPYTGRFTIQLSSRRNMSVNDKRWKILKGPEDGRARSQTLEHCRCHNRHRIVIVVSMELPPRPSPPPMMILHLRSPSRPAFTSKENYYVIINLVFDS